jgi:hypothetical protein
VFSLRPTLLIAGLAAVAAGLLGGCSDSWITAVGDGAPALARHENPQDDLTAPPAIGKAFADVALDDRELGAVRGGLSVGSGVVLNFAFQEATFVDHNLTQSIVVPTITVSPGSGTANVGGTTVAGGVGNFSPNSVAQIGNIGAQLPVSSPTLAVQSILNNGMTSIVSTVGSGGVTNLVSNTANNQLVQQLITANIDITGLSQTIQQSVASTVMSRVQAATSQFR